MSDTGANADADNFNVDINVDSNGNVDINVDSNGNVDDNSGTDFSANGCANARADAVSNAGAHANTVSVCMSTVDDYDAGGEHHSRSVSYQLLAIVCLGHR